MRRKNQIPKYYTPSPVEIIKKICEQSINEKSPNSVGY